MIKDRNEVKAGTTLTANYKGTAYTCEVSDGEDGELVFTFAGTAYSSITAPARFIVGGQPAEPKNLPHRNGWQFWSIAPTAEEAAETPEPTAEETAEATPAKPKKAKKTA